MKRLSFMLMMVLLTACGGGGGGGTGATGVLTVQTDKVAANQSIAHAAALVPPEPQYVRVVVSNTGFTTIIQDVQLGTAPTFVLPVGEGYQVDCISFAKSGFNRMLQYGVVSGVSITDGATTNISVTGTDITAPTITIPLVTGPSGPPQAVDGLYAGDVYTAGFTPPIMPVPLQANFNVAVNATTDFTGYPHVATAPVPAPSVTMPSTTSPTTAYLLGEFYIDTSFLKPGESATSWVITSPASTGPINLYVHGGTIGGDIFADTYPPHVTSFSPPTVVRSPTSLNLTISATDNVSVVKYLVTEVSTNPLPGDTRWNDPLKSSSSGSFSYTFDTPLAAGASTTLWAWAKDPSGNVSDLFTGRTVTYDNTPQVLSFTVPTATQFATTITPIAITGKNNTGADALLKYLVTETSSTPGIGDPWSAAGVAPTNYTVSSVTQLAGVRYFVPLYAWVMDGNNNISSSFSKTVIISDAPQVDTFTISTPVTTGTLVTVTGFNGIAAPGHSITGYLITKYNIKPTSPGDFSPTAPLNFDYTGLAPGVAASKPLYAWVIDERGVISLAKSAFVQFNAP
jgi:hypothetical protein